MNPSTYKYLIDSMPISEGGKPLLCLAFYVTLYFEDGQLRDKRQICVDLFEEYVKMCDEPLRWATDPERHTWKRFSPDLAPSAWLVDQQTQVWQYYYHAGQTHDACVPWRVQAFGYPLSAPGHKLSFVNAVLPVTWFAEHASTDAPTLVEHWCRTLKPLHGSAGIGILTSPDTRKEAEMAPHVRALARRFPGLEVDYPASHILYLRDGIKGVNWLTCLGDRWLEKLGGAAGLREKLGEEFILHEYPGGVLIQAGDAPQIGDVNHQIDVDRYRALSRVLAPVRARGHAPLRGFDQESTDAWFGRFDG